LRALRKFSGECVSRHIIDFKTFTGITPNTPIIHENYVHGAPHFIRLKSWKQRKPIANKRKVPKPTVTK